MNSENNNKKFNLKYFFVKNCLFIEIGLFVLVVIFAFLYYLDTDLDEFDFQIKDADRMVGLKMSKSKNEISLDKLLDSIYKPDFFRPSIEEWMNQNASLYKFNDQAVLDSIKTLSYEDEFAKLLREVRRLRQGPWNFPLDTVNVGIPNRSDRPDDNIAYVCINGAYAGKEILIINIEDHNKSVRLKAVGAIDCVNGTVINPIHLSKRTARKVIDGSLRKYNQVLISVVD